VDRVRLARGRAGRERITTDHRTVDVLAFRDPDRSVRDDADRIRSLSQIPADVTVWGHVNDARTGTRGR
jgi:hypothetical protein